MSKIIAVVAAFMVLTFAFAEKTVVAVNPLSARLLWRGHFSNRNS